MLRLKQIHINIAKKHIELPMCFLVFIIYLYKGLALGPPPIPGLLLLAVVSPVSDIHVTTLLIVKLKIFVPALYTPPL
jgi:hypothetical protein